MKTGLQQKPVEGALLALVAQEQLLPSAFSRGWNAEPLAGDPPAG